MTRIEVQSKALRPNLRPGTQRRLGVVDRSPDMRLQRERHAMLSSDRRQRTPQIDRLAERVLVPRLAARSDRHYRDGELRRDPAGVLHALGSVRRALDGVEPETQVRRALFDLGVI